MVWPWSQTALVENPLPSGQRRQRHGGRLHEIQMLGLCGAVVGRNRHAFGETAPLLGQQGVDRVTLLETDDALADTADFAGDVTSQR